MPTTGRMKDWPTSAILLLWLAGAMSAVAVASVWLGVRSERTFTVVMGALLALQAGVYVLLALKQRRSARTD